MANRSLDLGLSTSVRKKVWQSCCYSHTLISTLLLNLTYKTDQAKWRLDIRNSHADAEHRSNMKLYAGNGADADKFGAHLPVYALDGNDSERMADKHLIHFVL